MKKAILVLDDNTVFKGSGIGAYGSYWGELVFNTAMTGYMEALTDPSYAGQILTFTYPLIGNYGVTFKWAESQKIQPRALVIAENCDQPIHRESQTTLQIILEKQKIGGITGIDTRALTKIIRERGTIPAVLAVYENNKVDLVKQVTRKNIKVINPHGRPTIALIDYGLKKSIIQKLIQKNLKVIVFPATTEAQEILKYNPSSIVLSNGPGDPRDFVYAQKTIKDLLKKRIPIFGICLGHQLLALAAGAKIYKLKFGHRGINQPVINTKTKKAYIVSQNHSYSVDHLSLPKNWACSFINLNDGSVEGICHRTRPFFSVQFHPEANPGPEDTSFIFDDFIKML